MPKVSVIMPVYNSEKYISEAIHSVLDQTYQDFELIIVDDGSTDNTSSIVTSFQEKYPQKVMVIIHQKNQGVSQARNTAIKYSQGKYLMFADADDIQIDNRFELTMEKLEKNKVDIVFNSCQMIDANGRELEQYKEYPSGMTSENVLLYHLKRNYLWTSLVLIRKTKDIWFDPTIPNSVDYELFLRLFLKGYTLSIIDQPLVKYRLHNSNISSDGKKARKTVKKVLKELDEHFLYNLLKGRFGEREASITLAHVGLWREEPELSLVYLKEVANMDIESLFIKGVCHYKLGQYTDSLNIFSILEEESNQDPAVINNVGVLKLILGYGPEVSRDQFEKALSLRSDYMDTKRNLQALQLDGSELYFTERPLRTSFVHTKHYKI
jgi:glycosyltransferase involved in cell wall biosynthesis